MFGTAFKIKPAQFSAIGAAVTISVGLLVWMTTAGEAWTNASFDYLLRFGSREPSRRAALILMDNAAYAQFNQQRSEPWDRGLHAKLLNRLADDQCAMVVIDSFFRAARDQTTDDALAAALRRQKLAVLMAEQSQITHPNVAGVQPTLPFQKFVEATQTNWGVAWLDPDLDQVVRRHWPFPSPGPHVSLPEAAAIGLGAKLDSIPRERWLRYYGQNGPCLKMSYGFAFEQPPGFFRDYLVFVGNQPKTSVIDNEVDEFSTPYSRWTGESTGGVEILSTMLLNLLDDEALLRPPRWVEVTILCIIGILLGGGLCRLPSKAGVWVAIATFAAAPIVATIITHISNFWFPWLIVSGAQLPAALAWATAIKLSVASDETTRSPLARIPKTPGYKLIQPPFGSGAYGKVWLARDRDGKWWALKAIYLSHFKNHSAPYDREYSGIEKYLQISKSHNGLLQLEYLSPKGKEYFYYVMELGDAADDDWKSAPTRFRPRDLEQELEQWPGKRMPADECIKLGIALCKALGFIHDLGLTHRDIKPQNIIFVNGSPKLADLGLVTNVHELGEAGTLVGTPGYIAPPPDHPGTISADIYALGIVLYVVSTGKAAAQFPEMDTAALESDASPGYFALNNVILTACEPQPQHRFDSAHSMRTALEEILS